MSNTLKHITTEQIIVTKRSIIGNTFYNIKVPSNLPMRENDCRFKLGKIHHQIFHICKQTKIKKYWIILKGKKKELQSFRLELLIPQQPPVTCNIFSVEKQHNIQTRQIIMKRKKQMSIRGGRAEIYKEL